MKLETLRGDFTVCKIDPAAELPNMTGAFRFLSVTDREVSLLCESDDVPSSVITREDGWKGLRITGQLDFSLIGVLSELSAVLAREKIGIFVTSTYDTDYLFVKKENFARACGALTRAGHFIKENAGE